MTISRLAASVLSFFVRLRWNPAQLGVNPDGSTLEIHLAPG